MITTTKDIVHKDGKSKIVPGIQINGKRLIIEGRFLTVARLRNEWYDDLDEPAAVIDALKRSKLRPDLFTFWQRLPDTTPQYAYHCEVENLSAVPLSGFQHWWDHQIRSDTRKKAKRAEKRGIEIKLLPLNDELVSGVLEIFNDTPIRRGKPFWHYGKSFETVKEMLLRDGDTSKYIWAFDKDELVGFVKLVSAPRRFANPGLIVSKLKAQHKYVNSALLAKSVAICCADELPYLTYTHWRRGNHAKFLVRHGFEKTGVPRYWIPLTKTGQVALKYGFHRDIRTYVPDPLMDGFLSARKSFYHWWYSVADVSEAA